MKGYLFIALLVFLFSSCKTAESGDEANATPVRLDGIYIADDPGATPVTRIVGGKSILSRKTILLLRFYDAESGVMVPDNVDTSLVLYNDSLINRYYKWCKEFTIKNPGDTGYVNFKYKFAGDSIWFDQKAPEFSYKYSGKCFDDSISFFQTIDLRNNGHSAVVNKPYNFTFHKVNK